MGVGLGRINVWKGVTLGSGVNVLRGVTVKVAVEVDIGIAASVCVDAALAVCAINVWIALGSLVGTRLGAARDGTQARISVKVMNQMDNFV